jgi:hypothetical protein
VTVASVSKLRLADEAGLGWVRRVRRLFLFFSGLESLPSKDDSDDDERTGHRL